VKISPITFTIEHEAELRILQCLLGNMTKTTEDAILSRLNVFERETFYAAQMYHSLTKAGFAPITARCGVKIEVHK
jgi:hypothetical protein